MIGSVATVVAGRAAGEPAALPQPGAALERRAAALDRITGSVASERE